MGLELDEEPSLPVSCGGIPGQHAGATRLLLEGQGSNQRPEMLCLFVNFFT